MKKKRNLMLVGGVFAALTLLIGTAAVASPFGPRGEVDVVKVKRKLDRHVSDALEDLDATHEQKAATQEIVDRLFQDGVELHGDKRQTHAELKAMFAADEPDQARLYEIVDEKTALMNTMGKKLADAAIELHAILTPEQRAAVLAEIERARDRRHGMHGFH
jgi:Spy/CpxP family protein refolding chaperone